MARRGEGRSTFVVGEKLYSVVVDFNTLADFEAEAKCNAMQRFTELDTKPLSAGETRALFWAALRDGHPDISIRDAGSLLVSGQDALKTAMQSAMDADEMQEPDQGNV
ncbi:hypothetical protein ACTTAI_16350 [Rhodobacter capsulatus]|uniref:hypothetical protein n=1 Tax=Rhodobacter capsulatus TaxID=1061 RepID=UPI00402571AA